MTSRAVLVAVWCGILLLVPSRLTSKACGAVDECTTQCPDVYPSNVRAWVDVPNVPGQVEFYLKPNHWLENGPDFELGTYKTERGSDESKATDGSFWRVMSNSYYHAQCQCIFGLNKLLFYAKDPQRWTVEQVRAAPPKKKGTSIYDDDDPTTCDGGPCDENDGDQWGVPDGSITGYGDQFEVIQPPPPGNSLPLLAGSRTVCDVTDWYVKVGNGQWEYSHTSIDQCWTEAIYFGIFPRRGATNLATVARLHRASAS